MLASLPKELSLVLRSMFIVRAVNTELGAPVNRFSVMARVADKNSHDAHESSAITFETRLTWISIRSWFISTLVNCSLFLRSYFIRFTNKKDLSAQPLLV
jgi:hypothetical protein